MWKCTLSRRAESTRCTALRTHRRPGWGHTLDRASVYGTEGRTGRAAPCFSVEPGSLRMTRPRFAGRYRAARMREMSLEGRWFPLRASSWKWRSDCFMPVQPAPTGAWSAGGRGRVGIPFRLLGSFARLPPEIPTPAAFVSTGS